MKIHKDILQKLNINSIQVIYKCNTYFCIPLEIKENVWDVAIDVNLTIKGNAELLINKTDGTTLKYRCILANAANDIYTYYTCIYHMQISCIDLEEAEEKFFEEIKNLEKENKKWNKRKEERFEIKSNIQLLDLDSPQQKLITMKETLPCFLNNVSYSGAQVITYSTQLRKDKPICLNLNFINPLENIPIKAFIRNYEERNTKNAQNKLAIISMEFDHTPLSWQNRMNLLINKVKKL